MEFLENLGIKKINSGITTGTEWLEGHGPLTSSYSPADGRLIGQVQNATSEDYEQVMATAQKAFEVWRMVPAPQRGEVVRQISNALRDAKEDLGKLVSYETGKIYQEGLGEVQEMIDICDFAVGLSRQLYGLTMHSERPQHRLSEQYHPLGLIGIISAFNFPVAVWAWNAMVAAVCGDVMIWKPSEKAPLSAVAVQKIIQKVLKENKLPEGIFNLLNGQVSDIGNKLLEDKRLPLISATGSTRMGKKVGAVVGERLGRSLLELGGNNAIVITENADLKLAIPAIVFGAVGTCGQRCTSTRRLIIQDSIYSEVKTKLLAAYEQVSQRVGNPLDESTLIGPLIDKEAVDTYQNALEQVKQQGGNILCGGKVLEGEASGCYVQPALAEVENHYPIVQDETFAPLLFLIKYSNFDEALKLHNDVPQGLSSAIFTLNMREAEKFLSAMGSDCGIANVNIGTSGAEIGGAFGGEKETGGGRESGSDAWKVYMRRQTNTQNWGTDLPLAQGIRFDF